MRGITFIALILSLAGCSVKRMAVNKLGNALSSGGSSYETDDDPDLVADALPFSLKLIESLLGVAATQRTAAGGHQRVHPPRCWECRSSRPWAGSS
jgi:hypothetical protein